MTTLRYILASISGIFFLISFYTSIASLLGKQMPEEIMGLHGLIFLFFIPGMIFLFTDLHEVRKTNPVANARNLLEAKPRFLQVIIAIFLLYAVLNFMYNIGSLDNARAYKEGDEYYISGRDIPKTPITKEEYISRTNRIQAGFSGHWMLFYLGSCLLLLPTNKRKMEKLSQLEKPSSPSIDLGLGDTINYRKEVESFWDRAKKDPIFYFISFITLPFFIASIWNWGFIFIGLFLSLNHINLYVRHRYFLKKLVISESYLEIEYLDFLTLHKKNIPLKNCQVNWQEYNYKGNIHYELQFLEDGKKFFGQRNDNKPFDYHSLVQLRERIEKQHPELLLPLPTIPPIWYESKTIILIALYFFFPIGLYALKKNTTFSDSEKKKLLLIPILVSVLFLILLIVTFVLSGKNLS